MDAKYRKAFQQLELDSENTSWAEVRTSYKRKVQQLHPDRVQNAGQSTGDQDEFIKVTRAYKVLNEYHRSNNDLPRDYVQQTDPVMQINLNNINTPCDIELSSVLASIHSGESRRFSVLKAAVISCMLALLTALAILAFAQWQKSQVPPITPFTTEKPLPLAENPIEK